MVNYAGTTRGVRDGNKGCSACVWCLDAPSGFGGGVGNARMAVKGLWRLGREKFSGIFKGVATVGVRLGLFFS